MDRTRISVTKPRINDGVNIGHSSRLDYDKCAYEDRLEESVGPLLYRLNPHYINNCDACLSTFGPRAGHNGFGVSTTVGHTTAPAQDVVDVESVLKNLNVLQSKCKDGKVNDIDVTRFTLNHARTCNDFLDPTASRLTNPATNYRGMSINRFHDLPKPAQANPRINPYHRAENTKNTMRDNYRMRVPNLIAFDPALPKELRGQNPPCKLQLNCGKSNCGCRKPEKMEPENDMRYWGASPNDKNRYGQY
ncbi:MAG: hypothetical protein CMF62_00135 [Magnetococcales bacterium]|nr:hypothetical protein [Magnetococcales bacterium]|tara:strand:+ start:6091 stop:6834 length:744 start_codon:yes stop_codon:yes gene_type:complete